MDVSLMLLLRKDLCKYGFVPSSPSSNGYGLSGTWSFHVSGFDL